MNLGQIMETELGWAATALDEWYSTPVFQSASNEMIEAKLKEANLPTHLEGDPPRRAHAASRSRTRSRWAPSTS